MTLLINFFIKQFICRNVNDKSFAALVLYDALLRKIMSTNYKYSNNFCRYLLEYVPLNKIYTLLEISKTRPKILEKEVINMNLEINLLNKYDSRGHLFTVSIVK